MNQNKISTSCIKKVQLVRTGELQLRSIEELQLRSIGELQLRSIGGHDKETLEECN